MTQTTTSAYLDTLLKRLEGISTSEPTRDDVQFLMETKASLSKDHLAKEDVTTLLELVTRKIDAFKTTIYRVTKAAFIDLQEALEDLY